MSEVLNPLAIREYDFFRLGNCIYRVFSRCTDEGRHLGLIRYWHDGEKWFKPAKYGAEQNDPECLRNYNCPTVRPAVFGITLAAARREHVEYYYHSQLCFEQTLRGRFGHSAVTSVCRTLERLIVHDWSIPLRSIGITGSFVVGAHRPTSDLDLVIYLDRSASSLATCFMRSQDVLRPVRANESKMLMRFLATTNERPKNLSERAIFSAHVQDLKVDFHYARATPHTADEPLPEMRLVSAEMEYEVQVESAEQRHLYPGIMLVTMLSSHERQLLKLVCLDHSGHFLLRGDVVELSAKSFEVTLGNRDFRAGELVLVSHRINAVVPFIR